MANLDPCSQVEASGATLNFVESFWNLFGPFGFWYLSAPIPGDILAFFELSPSLKPLEPSWANLGLWEPIWKLLANEAM